MTIKDPLNAAKLAELRLILKDRNLNVNERVRQALVLIDEPDFDMWLARRYGRAAHK